MATVAERLYLFAAIERERDRLRVLLEWRRRLRQARRRSRRKC